MKYLFLILTLLLCAPLLSPPANAEPVLHRGASSQQIIAWVGKYDNLQNAASKGNESALFKRVQITFECERASLAKQHTGQGLSGGVFLDSTNTLSQDQMENIRDRGHEQSSKHFTSITQSCHEAGVASADEGLEWLLSLADGGYTPAQIYYVKTIPPSYSFANPHDMEEYKSKRSEYLKQSYWNGSGEGLFLLASELRSALRSGEQISVEDAKESYALTMAALRCGYSDSKIERLQNLIIDKTGVNPAETAERADEIFEHACTKGEQPGD